MKKIILKIGGMTCSACSSGLEKHLKKQDGILEASVNLVLQQASITYDETKVKEDDFDKIVDDAGFKNLGEYKFEDNSKNNKKIILFAYLFLLLFIMYISMAHMINIPELISKNNNSIVYSITLFILAVPFLIYGFDILKNGIKNLIYKHPNMDSLITVGVLASFIYSTVNMVLIINGDNSLVDYLYFESCAMIIYFVKLGRFIDNKSKEKTKEALKELVQITPEKAYLKRDGKVVEVSLDELKKGDILVCKPGDKFAVDGEIIKGSTHIDESFITGESVPVKKGVNSKVVAGSINIDGYVEYKAERIGKDSTISELVRRVLEASGTKAPIAHLADILSSYFVPGIFIIAIITFIVYFFIGSLNTALVHSVTVLTVACPCALGLATPLAIVVSVGKCAKNGILIKSSEILENASKVDTVIFDKTGTLTYGNLKVSKIINYSKYSEEELLSLVSCLEKQSNHPIAKAFTNIKSNYLVDEFKSLPGIGLYGEIDDKSIYIGNNKIFNELKITNKHKKDEEELTKELNTCFYVIINNKVVALFGVKDIIRDNAKEVIDLLKKREKDVVLLSGDNESVARNVGLSLGVNRVISNVVPIGKEEFIKREKEDFKVMMVGDGINDALALTSADIGVSINSGTDIAIDTSDVVLMNDDLNKIIDLIDTSKKTIKIIKENLFWAFFYNICMIPLAIGLFKIEISPMYGSIFMTLSSLIVVLNSLRLRK